MKTNYKLCSILLISLLFLIIALSNVSAIEVDSFTDMQNNITAGEDIELKSNIIIKDSEVNTFKEGIIIDHNVTIDGKGYSIDGNHKVRLFKITNNDVVLTLVNITLMNGNSVTGGAIDSDNDVNLNCKGTVLFSNNSVTNMGGAIYSDKNVFIRGNNVQFINNTVINQCGGAIYSYGNVDIRCTNDIIFNYNNGINEDGGAIYANKNVIINGYNIMFNNNKAASSGAIHALNLIITGNGDIIFNDNHAIRSNGGAIRSQYVSIIGSTIRFDNNTASNSGGAISSERDVDIIGSNIKFINNLIVSDNTVYGGAIFSQYGMVNIKGSEDIIFQNNKITADDNNGGAIWAFEDVIITGSIIQFINNTAVMGGGIFSYEGFINLTSTGNVTFKDNYAIFGGAIWANNNVIITGSIIQFNNNTANNGGAILCRYDISIIGSIIKFLNNKANNGGAIYTKTFNIANAIIIFNNNTAKNEGENIYLTSSLDDSSLNNCFWGLNYKNRSEIINNHLIYEQQSSDYVAPEWWLLLDVEKPDIIASDINNTFKLVLNKRTNGDEIIDIKAIPAFIIVNLTEDSNIVPSQALVYFNFTTNHTGNYIIHIINSYNGIEINNISFTVDNAPFSKLAELINNNQLIILQKSYNYYQELDYKLVNGIKITKNTTIDGAGYTLDAKNLANIFQVEKGVKLILKNINLANANIAIINNGILDLTNVTSKAPIYNKGIITSGVKFIIYSNKVTTYDSFLVSLKTDSGIPIMVSNLKYSDDQGHNYKSFIFTKDFYVNYVPEGITGHVTFNNVELNGFTNLTSTGSLDITKYPTVKTKVINIPVKEVVKSTVSKLTTVLKTNTLNLVNNFFKTVMR